MKLGHALLVVLSIGIFSQNSFAFESESNAFGYQDEATIESSDLFNVNQSDATRVQKFEAALEALGIPQEPAADYSNFVHANESNQAEVQNNLQWIDPDKGLARYLSIVNGNLQMFRDFFKSMISLDYLEYQQTLSTDNPSSDSSSLIQRLNLIAMQAQAGSATPLNGLKILIDPGHMGGNAGDQFTGKFVSIKGHKVSEGDLNLWTALLTAKKLEKLGATVMLTREKQGAVSTEDPQKFDTTPYINNYFQTSMDDWMAPYLVKSIDQIRSSIKSAPEVLKAYTQTQRAQFFISNVDLEARSKMVDTFNPDITLDIHYDASNTAAVQNINQSLEAFVPGGFLLAETGGRKNKMFALKHLLETRRWNHSVDLADSVTLSMSKALGINRLSIPRAQYSPTTYAQKVRDGVYARNLYISRRALSSLVVYLECMHYDYAKEFKKLLVRDRTADYHSETFQYPNRLDTISDSIQNGFLDYFKNLKQ